MVKFQTKAGKLLQLFLYIQAEGKTIKGDKKPFNIHAVLHVKDTEATMEAQDEHQGLIAIGILRDVKAVDDPGDIPVEFVNPKEKDKPNSIKDLGRYGSEDEITVEYNPGQNKIHFKRSKPSKLNKSTPTIPMDKIETKVDYVPFEFQSVQNAWRGKKKGFLVDNYVKINTKQFEEVIKDGDQIQHRSFPFTMKEDGTLNVIVEDLETGEKFDRDLEIVSMRMPDKIDENNVKITEVKSIYSYGFGNAFGQLSGEIELWMASNGPMIIKKTDDDIEVTYILATLKLRKEDEKIEAGKKEVSETEKTMLDQLDQDLAKHDQENPVSEDDYVCDVCGERYPANLVKNGDKCSKCGKPFELYENPDSNEDDADSDADIPENDEDKTGDGGSPVNMHSEEDIPEPKTPITPNATTMVDKTKLKKVPKKG